MTATYLEVHAALVRERGRAANHVCACGKQAQTWAYLHNADDVELRSRSGAPYSENLYDHYSPMCRSCHCQLDVTVGATEALQAARRRNGAKVGSNLAFVETRRANGAKAAAYVKERLVSDPVFAKRRREACAQSRDAVSWNRLFPCSCGRWMSRSNLNRHMAAHGHIETEVGEEDR